MWIRNDQYRKMAPDDDNGGGGDPDVGDPTGGDNGDPGGADPSGGDGGDPQGGAPAWPDDWRSQMSGGDEKMAAQLERFTTPADVSKSFFEARSRISAGDVLKPLPEDATEDDIAAFREQQGIPGEAAGYLENMPDGLVVGEADKEVFESFAEMAHKSNMPPSVVHNALSWYNNLLDEQNAQTAELDLQDKTAFEDEMRPEWGADYRTNVNVVNALIDKNFTDEVGEMLRHGRGQDGRALFNNADFMRGMASMARQLHPLSTVLPSGQDSMTGLAERKAEIEKFMRTNRDEYNRDNKMQAEYRELIDVELKSKQNAA